MANFRRNRGVWHSKSSAKGQNRSSALQKRALGTQDKKESPLGSKGGFGQGPGASKERGSAWQPPEATQDPVIHSIAQVGEHTPVNGYNARAVEAALKAAVEPQPSIYKPAERPPPGARPGPTPGVLKRMICELWNAEHLLTTDSELYGEWQRLLG